MGSLSDGGCADASGMLGWYRVSSCLLNHNPGAKQARCSGGAAQRLYRALAHSMPSLSVSSIIILCAAQCARWRSGVSALWALDTLLPLSPFYAPLPPLHRSSTSPEDKIAAKWTFVAILLKYFRHTCQKSKAVLSSVGETETACRIRSRTSASLPHIPHLSKSIFRVRSAGR